MSDATARNSLSQFSKVASKKMRAAEIRKERDQRHAFFFQFFIELQPARVCLGAQENKQYAQEYNGEAVPVNK